MGALIHGFAISPLHQADLPPHPKALRHQSLPSHRLRKFSEVIVKEKERHSLKIITEENG